MIPTFPKFKPLDIADKGEVEAFTRRFPPYSDFNFVSLISYNVQDDFTLSFLHGNLIIRLRDYLPQKRFYTFLGKERVVETVETLLLHSADESLQPILHFVPEMCFDAELPKCFEATVDESASDYLISVERLLTSNMGKLKGKRKTIRQFNARNRHAIVELDIRSRQTRHDIESLCQLWQEQNGQPDETVKTEFTAIRRCLEFSDHLDILAIGIVVNDRLAGFTVNEILPHGFYMGHFGKTDRAVHGIGDFLEVETARIMDKCGCSVLNNQQDLGLSGLRRAKQSWMPVGFLKKFTVSAKGNNPLELLE